MLEYLPAGLATIALYGLLPKPAADAWRRRRKAAALGQMCFAHPEKKPRLSQLPSGLLAFSTFLEGFPFKLNQQKKAAFFYYGPLGI